MSGHLVSRFRRWVVAAIAVGALCYLAASIWAGMDEVGSALARFDWRYLFPLAGLTLVNYVLRFFKWHYFLRKLGVAMPFREDAWNFFAGLSMAISPGKAGELLKPYVVRERTGTPMARTIPALVSERLTDAVAMLIIAAFGVGTYAADQVSVVVSMGLAVIGGLVLLSSRTLSLFALGIVERLPLLGRIAPKLRAMYEATRVCLAPGPLAVTVGLSIVAWMAECIAFWQTFAGFGLEVSPEASIYIYASSTIIGAPSPGGLGVTDGAMAVGAMTLMNVERGVAVPAALITRVVTLWMGVGLGAIALFRVSALLGGEIELGNDKEAEGGSPS